MDWLAPIEGVSIEQYAKLCVQMMDTGEDVAAQVAIAEAAGVSAAAWNAAKEGWTARMQDPANLGKVAQEFMKHYQGAQAAARGGAPPCTLEEYAKIHSECAFEKDADGVPLTYEKVLPRYGLTVTKWGEYNGYWTPKVNDPADPAMAQWAVLVQKESDRINGIVRDPPKPAAPAPAPAAAPKPAPEPEPEATDIVSQITKFFKGLFG